MNPAAKALFGGQCAGRSFRAGRTNAKGAATFRVQVPGTFLDDRHRPVYFRDGERIDIEVIWEGPGEGFDVASPDREPTIVRSHGSRHD